MILSVCGKGGVGKTTVSAVAAQVLSEKDGVRALVVDADPAGGLAVALGLEPRKTLNDVRKNRSCSSCSLNARTAARACSRVGGLTDSFSWELVKA